MRNDRKYTNNSDTDDYIFGDDIDEIDEVEIEENMEQEKDGYEDSLPQAEKELSDIRKKRHIIISVSAVAAAVILIVAGIIIERNMPSGKRVDYNEYYGIGQSRSVGLIYDYELCDYQVILQNGQYYIENDFYKENITDKFYYDKGNDDVIYTTPTQIYTMPVDAFEYHIDDEKIQCQYAPVIKSQDEIYISVEFVADKAGFSYEVFSAPDRLAIMTDKTEYSVVELNNKAVVRDKASVKGRIFEKIADGSDTVWVSDGYGKDGWIGVMANDGRKGYVKSDTAEITDSKLVFDSGYVGEEYTDQLKDYRIVLVWHAIYDINDNLKISELLNKTEGVTTVSPTWYKVTGEDGSISSFADWEYIRTVHDAGMEIWPLISDFTSVDENNGWDETRLFSETESRRRLIDNIVTEIVTYGYDGINIDFEKVPQEAGEDYKQFIRELSIECRKAGVVLSIDNYVPRSYNTQYNRAAQAECADYVIVMGYDEHYAGSEEAGSVASIDFVTDGIDGTLDEVPKEKLINALPFYTRLWIEEPDENGNYTLNSKSYSMQDGINIAHELELEIEWDDEVKQNVAKGVIEQTYYSIWLEDEESMKAKMDVVRDRDLAGVAGWCLGMELESVWDIIKE